MGERQLWLQHPGRWGWNSGPHGSKANTSSSAPQKHGQGLSLMPSTHARRPRYLPAQPLCALAASCGGGGVCAPLLPRATIPGKGQVFFAKDSQGLPPPLTQMASVSPNPSLLGLHTAWGSPFHSETDGAPVLPQYQGTSPPHVVLRGDIPPACLSFWGVGSRQAPYR